MMSRNVISMLLITALPLTMTSALGNNNFFLPGDAYFPTEMTEKEILEVQAQPTGERTFHYSALGGYDMAFCGNAGFKRVTFSKVDDQFAENLASAYALVRERAPRQFVERVDGDKRTLEETNGIQVLFYNASFPFPEHKLGLRYNESWVSEVVRFGHERQHVRLCCLLGDPQAIQLSWRDAETVKPLVRAKPVLNRERKQGPALIVSDPVKAFVISPYSLDELFRFGRTATRRVYVVDSTGVQELRNDEGKWGPPTDNDSPF